MNAVLVAGAAATASLGLLAWGLYDPNAPLFGAVIGRGPRTPRCLYLTFDDGPSPGATPAVLAALEESRVPAAFFMTGRHARLFPDLVRQVAAAGHAVGNHTDTHRKLHLLGPRAVELEIGAAHATLESLTGRAPRLFRAPHGLRNPWVSRAAARHGYRVFGWTFGVWDSDRPGTEEIRRRVRRRLTSGAIILLHDGDGYDPRGDRSQTARALPGIIRDARELGYEFAPPARLADGEGA